MTAVWCMDMPPTEKMVLLALADAANDDGVTWLAVRSKRAGKSDLITKTSLSERAIQTSIKRLCERGLLHRCEKPGKGVIYSVLPPAADAPQQDMRPAPQARTPAADAPKPSVTVIGSGSKEPSLVHPPKIDDRFDEFWKLYPRKIAKTPAHKAYLKALKETDHGTLVAGLIAQIGWGIFAEPKYSPHAATWLGAGRWSDERDGRGKGVVDGANPGAGRSGVDDIASIVARRHAEDDARMEVPGRQGSVFRDDSDWSQGAIEGEYRPGDSAG
ncbi:hypothetical protein UFOVP679_26 [uncultured Caudovirales phage]|uniref:Helix-turn-helix domain containing protein n=1 Tax=uncultured Caudovirales phage TaxID=2100421 RepID=A0A6J5NF13_9CAUD|nr:hypothetical protein UFOVP679_26 [uncultured Caudovirales phage]